MERTCCISCSISVLRARVAEIDLVRVDGFTKAVLWLVMYYSSTGHMLGNAHDMLDLGTYFSPVDEMVGKESSL